MRRLIGVATLAVAAALTVAPDGSLARFSDTAEATSGTLSSGSVGVPVAPTATQAGPQVVRLSWAATALAGGGGAQSASVYQVLRFASASGGTGSVVCSSTTRLFCDDVAAPTPGSSWYLLRARVGTNWFRDGARTQYTPNTSPDGAPPTVSLTGPATGATASGFQIRAAIGDRCGSASVLACGTAIDRSGTSSVTASLRRVQGSTHQCWNGTAYAAATAATVCPLVAVNGTLDWSMPGNPSTAYPSVLATSNYTLIVRAVDGVGNAGSTSFTYSTSVP